MPVLSVSCPLQSGYRKSTMKRTRADRQIVDYLAQVKDSTSKPPASYEMILTIRNKECHPSVKKAERSLSVVQAKLVVVFRAYFHADRPDSAPHARGLLLR